MTSFFGEIERRSIAILSFITVMKCYAAEVVGLCPISCTGTFLQKKFLGKIQRLGKLFLIEIGIITDVIACVHMYVYISTLF